MNKYLAALLVALISFPASTFALTLPAATGLFETSLQGRISSSDTSLTLTSTSTRGGGTIGAGYHCLTLDEGLSTAEWVCGTLSANSNVVSGLLRGISPNTGTSTISGLQYTHRVGADVKITDFPLIQMLKAILNGNDGATNIIWYTAHPTFTANTQLVDKKYVDDTAFSGASVIDANTSSRGVVELATGAEAAASTAQGSSGVLVLPASIATSTKNSATGINVIPITNGSGFIDNNFLATSTLFATSSIYSSIPTVGLIGKNSQLITTTGTSTFTVPTGVTKLKVTVVGCGGNGGAGIDNGATGNGGGGGGGGGTAIGFIDVTGTTTIQVFVGANGCYWSTFGTNGYYLSATGGTNGTSSGNPLGGLAGVGSGGWNLGGQDGGSGGEPIAGNSAGGLGGSSFFGGGGRPGHGSTSNGASGHNYGGGGGGGGGADSGTMGSGGLGAQGAVLTEW